MRPGNPFILGVRRVKGQGHESQNITGVSLCILAGAGYF